MRTVLVTALFCMVCGANASAQSPRVAGKAWSADASLGYSYLSHPESPTNRIGLKGVEAGATLGFNSWLGITADLGYSRAANVLGTPSHSDVLTYLAGPVFYPTAQRRVRTYVHGLMGGARVTGPVPVSNGFLIGSWATGFAWAVGGGVEYQVSNSFAVRSGVDYLRTSYFGASLAIQSQNNIRANVSVVYHFGTQRGKRR